MIVYPYHITYKYGETIKLKIVADWHVGNKYCDERCIKKYISDSDDKTYFLGLGDIFDAIIVSDKKRYLKSSDGTEGDDILDQQEDKIYSILEPVKDRIIGLGSGNHEQSILKYSSTNLCKRLSNRLGTKYLGYSYIVKLFLREQAGRGRSVIIRGVHGWGGASRSQGGDLTKYSKDLSFYDSDIALYGHCHKLQADRIPRLSVIGNRLVSKDRHLILCGSFLKTLSDDENPSYAELAGYPPIPIGAPTIAITPNNNWVKIKVDL